jgi:hypothetical protein
MRLRSVAVGKREGEDGGGEMREEETGDTLVCAVVCAWSNKMNSL